MSGHLVDADDPIVADLLASTLELISESGGWVHPDARLVARRGQLSLECEGDDGSPLLRVPRGAWVRVDQVGWDDDPERLLVQDLPADIGDIELPMLYTQAALHNQTDRLRWLTRTHPSLAADLPPEVIAAVRRLVPGFRATTMHPRDLLFANRCFRMQLDDGAPQRVLVPVVDLLNHHTSGAAGTMDGGSFSVAVRRPFGDAECALDYGMDRDALEMAVVYGFADTSATVAHSAPVTVDVPGAGIVRVLGAGRAANGALLPVQSENAAGDTELTRMTFRVDDPAATVTDVIAATGWDHAVALAVVQAVAAENLDCLRHLGSLCDGVASSTPARTPARTLADAARQQASILSVDSSS